MDNSKIDLFENYSIPKAAMKLCIPTVLSSLVMVLYNIADTYFVGLLNDPVESSAVALAAPALLAFNAINNLFGVGTSSMMSRWLGKKEYDTVKKISAFGFYSALASGLLVSILYTIFNTQVIGLLGADSSTFDATGRYLMWTVSFGAAPAILNVVLSNIVRAEGAAGHAGIGVISGCVLNVIIDPFFVLPSFLGMGAAGAGLATFISNSVACVYFIILILAKRKTTCISLSIRQFTIRKDIVKGVFGVGVPSSVQNILNVTGSILLNNYTADYGVNAVSAMGIAHKAYMIPMYVCMGFAQGIMPLVSYNYSSGNRKRMKAGIMFVGKLTVIFSVIVTVAVYIFSADIVRLFMNNDAVVAHGEKLLRAMCLGTTFLAMDFLGVGIYQAIGKGLYAFIFAIMRKLVLEIPAIIILNMIYPLYGLGYASVCAEVILAIAAVFMLKKIVSEKSIKA